MRHAQRIGLLTAAFLALSAAGGDPIVEWEFNDPDAPYGKIGNRPALEGDAIGIKMTHEKCLRYLKYSQDALDAYNAKNPGEPEDWDKFDLERAREHQVNMGILRAFCARAKARLDLLTTNR